jgi:predicted RNA binding protein YcfA (HicA-like mRNA interferase family)
MSTSTTGLKVSHTAVGWDVIVIPADIRSGEAVKPVLGIVRGMPKKIRELARDLGKAGWVLERGAGKGSHRKIVHPQVRVAVRDAKEAK